MNPLFRFAAAVGVVLVPFFANACDICGCAGGGNSLGLLPLMQRHFVGFRWQAQGFHTDAHGSEANSTEIFGTLDLWGRWQPHRRVQVIATLPYQLTHRRFDDGEKTNTRGLGDASLLAQFSLLDPQWQTPRDWQHSLQIGGGLKLPSGKNTLSDSENQPLLPAQQPGTGSTDWLVSGLYALRHGNWGASLDASLRLTGTNAVGYRFGNRANATCRIFFNKKSGKTSLLPFLGAMLDIRDRDVENGIRQSDTGGWAMLGMVGAEVFRGDCAFNLAFQLPLASDFANGRVVPTARLNASAVLLFGGKKSETTPMTLPEVFPPVSTKL